MSKLIVLSGVFVALVAVTFDTTDAEAGRCGRNRGRRCCGVNYHGGWGGWNNCGATNACGTQMNACGTQGYANPNQAMPGNPHVENLAPPTDAAPAPAPEAPAPATEQPAPPAAPAPAPGA